MADRIRLGDPARPGYEACTGCGVCALPCPVWHRTHDVMMTLHGRARALQGGATAQDLAPSLAACVTCGACEPACPEGIDTVGMTLDLRSILVEQGTPVYPGLDRAIGTVEGAASTGDVRFLPGKALRDSSSALDSAVRVLGIPAAPDDGRDIAMAVEGGIPVSEERRERFLRSLDGAREVIVAEGILHSFLRRNRPALQVVGLGEALLRRPGIRGALRATDLYVVESRGYHADFKRLVKVYARLRDEVGCVLNLDLQRIAIPTGATCVRPGSVSPAEQARWILEGRSVERIVVESVEDGSAFDRVARAPVVPLAEVAG